MAHNRPLSRKSAPKGTLLCRLWRTFRHQTAKTLHQTERDRRRKEGREEESEPRWEEGKKGARRVKKRRREGKEKSEPRWEEGEKRGRGVKKTKEGWREGRKDKGWGEEGEGKVSARSAGSLCCGSRSRPSESRVPGRGDGRGRRAQFYKGTAQRGRHTGPPRRAG